ncbi:MAG: hypothetical protein H7A24_14850 [Leptospiraceae bacterium]|nr:hypothetical protein [Leptospiraceae bacterium]MCP5513162.1 hypothetical protein [Leptospiraceae bacterium]
MNTSPRHSIPSTPALPVYKGVDLDEMEFYGVELTFQPEDGVTARSPGEYTKQETYYAIELPESSGKTTTYRTKIFDTLRQEISTMFQVEKVETDHSLPFIEVRKVLES